MPAGTPAASEGPGTPTVNLTVAYGGLAMCRDCTSDLHELLDDHDRFEGTKRRIVEIDEVDGDDVYVDGGSNPAFHVSHAAEVLHWLRDDHFVCGVSSGTTAIATMLGEGKLAECNRCAQSASDIWAILNAMPGVQRDGTSGLAPDPSGR